LTIHIGTSFGIKDRPFRSSADSAGRQRSHQIMILRKPDKTKVNEGRANVHYCDQKKQQSTQRQSTSHERKMNTKAQTTKAK
jgi:hypothetical protein